MKELLSKNRIAILDGATGTELQKRGMPMGCCTERWVLEHPEALLDLQRGYIAAGSQMLIAPTFAANEIALRRHGITDGIAEMNRELVALSAAAAGENVPVLGDIAPTGLTLGNADGELFERLYENFRAQAAALEAAGVDGYQIETQMALSEARASVLAVKSVSDKPVFVTFTLGADGRLLSGGDICAACVALEPLGIAGFGVNCVGEPDVICDALKRLRTVTALPLLAKPNAGLPVNVDGKMTYCLSPEELGTEARRFVSCGASGIGGCCGTDERHIRAIESAVRGMIPARAEAGTEELICSEYAVAWAAAAEKEEPAVLRCDEMLAENAAECGKTLLRLEICEEKELDELLEQQFLLRQPLIVSVPEGVLRQKFLRCYRGKAKLL